MSDKLYSVEHPLAIPDALRPAGIPPLVRRMFGHNPKDQRLQEIFLMRIIATRRLPGSTWYVEFWVTSADRKSVRVGIAKYSRDIPREKVLEVVNDQLANQDGYYHRPPKELILSGGDRVPEDKAPNWVVCYTTLVRKTP